MHKYVGSPFAKATAPNMTKETQNNIQLSKRKACRNWKAGSPGRGRAKEKPAGKLRGSLKAGNIEGSNLKWAGLHKEEAALKS